MLAVALLMNLLFYTTGAVIELIAFGMYSNNDMEFAYYWFNTVGYWGSLIAYFLPPFFAVL